MRTHCLTPLAELRADHRQALAQLGLYIEERAQGDESVGPLIARLDSHIDLLEEQILRHPDATHRTLEVTELARLGR